MPEFQIGLAGCGGGLESPSNSGLLELAESAEALGFVGLWLNEEHYQGGTIEEEGRRCLSPVPLAAAILARTTSLRVGFSVLLLALHHPVRLAEEIATLDVLSNGRVDFGISRGGNLRYLGLYDIDPKAAAADRFKENISLMRSLWNGAEPNGSGHPASIEPKPVQKPHPPIFIATYTDETVQWAARNGHHLISHGITNLAFAGELLRQFAAAGGDISRVPFGRFVYVSESDSAAKQELWPTILKITNRLKSLTSGRAPRFIREADLEPETFYREMVIAGGPESCARRINDLRRDFGINYLNALSAFFGFLPTDLVKNSLHLLATEVAPRVRRTSLTASRAGTGLVGLAT